MANIRKRPGPWRGHHIVRNPRCHEPSKALLNPHPQELSSTMHLSPGHCHVSAGVLRFGRLLMAGCMMTLACWPRTAPPPRRSCRGEIKRDATGKQLHELVKAGLALCDDDTSDARRLRFTLPRTPRHPQRRWPLGDGPRLLRAALVVRGAPRRKNPLTTCHPSAKMTLHQPQSRWRRIRRRSQRFVPSKSASLGCGRETGEAPAAGAARMWPHRQHTGRRAKG